MLIQFDHGRKFRFIVSGVIFLILAFMVWRNALLVSTVDAAFQTLFTSNHPSGFMTAYMKFISFLGSPKMTLLWGLLLAVLLWGLKFKVAALWSFATLVTGDAWGWIIKHLIQRARPAQHLAADDGFSFPSGHTLGTFLIAGIVLLVVVPIIQNDLKRRVTIAITIVFVALLAISRVYLYAHFPTDTIGAMLLGYTWLQIMEVFYVKLAPTMQRMRYTRYSLI
ncbi:phosphatase PAP2 family protein [Limosilactobacillus equigenerosi]|nr:phosphatase PAP2 family protein [Limosilactobacillus equigenerosi]MCQ2569770.1 phosphatase PAP2 family protein [Limosilactobacillus sp.]